MSFYLLDLQDVVRDGQLLLASLIALLAGIISFASPCVLPLVPGYLGYVGGIAGSDEQGSKGRVALGATLFVLGFTVVFVGTMAFAGSLAVWLLTWQDLLLRVLGLVVIVMGFVFMGFMGKFQNTHRVAAKPKLGLAGAPLLGVTFAVGWAPCIGPTLATIFTLGFGEGTMVRASFLALWYSIGLGLPFIFIALGFGWMTSVTSFFRRHIRAINLTGGIIMIVIGLLMVSGIWNYLMSSLQGVIDSVVPPL